MKINWNFARMLSLVLVAAICLNMIPFQVFATGEKSESEARADGMCEHHPFHTAECGYVEAAPETPCTHEHTEECWDEEVYCVHENLEQADSGEESAEDTSSADEHVCSEATGCVIKILDCQHQHDEACGYAPAVPGHPCEFVCPICSQAEDTQTKETGSQDEEETEETGSQDDEEETDSLTEEETEEIDPQTEEEQIMPYYLLITHTLDYCDTQYGFSEVIGLTEEELQDGGYDLQRHVLEKDGMAVAKISCFNPETGDLDEAQALSPDSFAEGGDPESGEGYFAAQVLIEYRVLDGYRPVLSGDSSQMEDPYGVMPLTSFRGGNIKDITFVSADVLTVRIEYKYSPTGGLAGIDAADSQVFQMKVERDDEGNIKPFTETWDLPCYNGTANSNLDGFRIVLDPAPLNAFVNDPGKAADAMAGKLSQEEIEQALENDAFSVKTDGITDPNLYVYYWQEQNLPAPDTYEAYPESDPTTSYGNRYSEVYNEAWDKARTVTPFDSSTKKELYTVTAFSEGAVGLQGANPLITPQLRLTMTPEQYTAALNSGKEIKITVYYRRNAGFYHVAHWVRKEGLAPAERTHYEKEYGDYNKNDEQLFKDGYIMVFLERRQGRVGALTNAWANPQGAEVLKAFSAGAVNQKTIAANTRVDILYETAERYGLIFQTDGSYIPRQYVNKGYTVTFTAGAGKNSMQVTDVNGNTVGEYEGYSNPSRQGYTFKGWKYEVRSNVTGDGVTEENGKKYRTVVAKTDDAEGTPWKITQEMINEAVVMQDSGSGDAKMIYLYPVWSPDMANVRVVYWTENLSGGANDVDVDVDNTPGGSDYKKRIGEAYQNGTPTTVGNSFSNVGSFTFMAPTNSTLDLHMDSGKFATNTAGRFTTSGESTNPTGTLNALIDIMFPAKMSGVEVSTKEIINTSKFYHPYSVQTPPSGSGTAFDPEHSRVAYTVAADGSTVINVYYARNVYKLDFTYYGEIYKKDGCVTGTNHDGGDGLVVATNTTAYSKRTDPQNFDYSYQISDENRWQPVKVKDAAGNTITPDWTVPQTLSILAKYDADLREVWPLSQGEAIKLTLGNEKPEIKAVAIFMSWGATAGPFNRTYREGTNNESTIIGNYRSMSADIIADPESPSTVHHLVAYWWNKYISNYRRNACYEVPELTAKALLEATDTKAYDLKNRTIYYDFTSFPEGNRVGANPLYGLIAEKWRPADAVFQTNVSKDEATRRDTLYLVPVNGTLQSYFKDYDSNFIRVDEHGDPAENGGYYAVRRVSLEDNSKVYALGRQAMSVSTNWIDLQAPTAMPNMTTVEFAYICEGQKKEKVKVDHDTRAWDNWGRTETALGSTGFEPFVALGTVENPYDIWFYYDRERFTIFYMVASRNSKTGEYEIGRHETIYGQNMSRYNLDLMKDPSTGKDIDTARLYSNAPLFSNYWTPTKNTNALDPDKVETNGLNKEGYTRLSPDSAVDGKGKWTCEYWSLDRSGSGVMKDDDWNRMVTGNLRVFAQWTPPQYKVKFDFDGGSYNGKETFPIQTVNANVGYTSSGKPIPSPTKTGYVFSGWTWYEGKETGTDSDLTEGPERKDFTFETPITRNMVLKAKWISSAKTTYNYKIWYLTDASDASIVTKPSGVEGAWLAGNYGTPQPDSEHTDYSHVLGCQYVGGKELPENTDLHLAAVAIPGYIPVKVSATLALDTAKNGTGPADTENVTCFYYQKSRVKTYTVRYQLWDKEGDEGILDKFTIHRVVANSTYFTPGKGSWQTLRDAGYYLVQMDEHGKVQMNGSGPVAAGSYEDLEDFINSEVTRYNSKPEGTNMVVTFKVAPFHYTIQYRVGTVKRGSEVITPGDALTQAMQDALDKLTGGAAQTAMAAGKNPTQYVPADFSGGFTLKNPPVVKNPDNQNEEWRFTGWSLGQSTMAVSRSQAEGGEYPTLLLERSEGDLEFLANWEFVYNTAPPTPEKPPEEPEKPENPGDLPTELPDPNIPDSPEVITILENGVPTTYRKVWDPKTETWIYVPEEEAPLHGVDGPDTGDYGVFPWGLFSILSLSGIVVCCGPRRFQKPGKKKE